MACAVPALRLVPSIRIICECRKWELSSNKESEPAQMEKKKVLSASCSSPPNDTYIPPRQPGFLKNRHAGGAACWGPTQWSVAVGRMCPILCRALGSHIPTKLRPPGWLCQPRAFSQAPFPHSLLRMAAGALPSWRQQKRLTGDVKVLPPFHFCCYNGDTYKGLFLCLPIHINKAFQKFL